MSPNRAIAALVRRRVLTSLAGLALLGGAGCASLGGTPKVSLREEWEHTLTNAQQLAAVGRYDEADSVLTSFATRRSNTVQAVEAQYWLGVIRLDPDNRNATLPSGIAALDRYLTATISLSKRPEAATLRGLAARLESTTKLAAASVTTQTSTARPAASDDRAKEEEIQRLKSELSKANEELDRIKKRLAAPKP
jgi:hypothetical protein